MKYIPAKALCKNVEGNLFSWQDILINQYNLKDETFSGVWSESYKPLTVSRVHLCFDVNNTSFYILAI